MHIIKMIEQIKYTIKKIDSPFGESLPKVNLGRKLNGNWIVYFWGNLPQGFFGEEKIKIEIFKKYS